MRRFGILTAICGALLAGTLGMTTPAKAAPPDTNLQNGSIELAQYHRGWRPARGFGYYPRPYYRNNYYYGGYRYPGTYYQTYRPYYNWYW